MPGSCMAATDTLASSQGPFKATIIPTDLEGRLSICFACRGGQRRAGEIVWCLVALALKTLALVEDSH